MKKDDWLKSKLLPILSLIFVVAITIGILVFYNQNPDMVEKFKGYGYPGAFLISLMFNATLILPAGNIIVISVLGGVLPSATLVGLLSGAGAALGEITGYMAGYSGRGLAQRSRTYYRVEGWLKRWGTPAIFVMAMVPFVFDLVGIAAGVLRYPFWKFMLVSWIGRTMLYVVVAWIGAWGWEAVLT